MKVLVVNSGSSSLKFSIYEMPEEKELINGTVEKIGLEGSFYTLKLNGEKIKKEAELPTHFQAIQIILSELIDLKVIESFNEIEAVGHRVVHGGDKYASSVLITDDVIDTLEELIPLAPLHNPANIAGLKEFGKAIPNATAVGVFDTAFHQTMSEESYLYGVPYDWYKMFGVRKYGFHGTSHRFLAKKMQEITGKKNGKFISCHLGNGASLCAIKDGKSIDTTMGFTPNAGVIMGTRSGDIDSTIIPYIMNQTDCSLSEVFDDLNKRSGMLGISGVSSDSRDIEDGINNSDSGCIRAQNMYVKSVVGYIAKYYVELGGCDAICFAGGIGEKSVISREQIIEQLKVLGIKLDKKANDVRGEERLISTIDSSIPVYTIPTDEELMIARDTYKIANGEK